jgi:2-dehydropantoate 2-reductase
MRFLVLGAGALGGYFGAKLIRGGADVTFLVRPARAAQLQRDGLIVKAQDGEIRTPAKTIQHGQLEGTYDVVLLCCKAYDLASAVNAIAPAIGDQSVILPLLNGVGHIDILTKRFEAERVLGGLTVINVAMMPDGTIQQSELKINITAIGELDGRMSSRCTAIETALDAGGLPVHVTENITTGMWMKFFGFACSATIASLARSRAGAIASSDAGASFVSNVIDECMQIFAAEGHSPPSDTVGMVRGIFLQPNSAYGPSLLIDMEHGRPTEGDHTIGDLVGRAARRGLAAPILNAALCNLQAYETNRIRRMQGETELR